MMDKLMKNFITAALLICTALCLCGCSDNWEAPYASLDQDGYNVSVRFDANGGMFAGINDVYVVDVYNTANGVVGSDGTVGFYLLKPEDPIRAEGAFTVSRNGYFLAGWYTERSLRVDENGEALDEYGVKCSISGKEQGYTYSDLWDFDKDLVTVDPSENHSAEKPVTTLYAAWVPYINYDFYSVDASGTSTYLTTVQSIDLEIPEWSTKSGKLDLKKFPESEGFTFDAAYLDAALTQPLTQTIFGAENYVDYTTGTTSTTSVSVYTTWLEGTWYKIYTAEQFYKNSRLDCNYMICNDIDFSDTVWSPTLVKGKFSGKIYGNGYTISNINVIQADNSTVNGGLFGTLESGAVIQDLKLENVTVTIGAGSRMQGASFGLLAGTISEDASFSNVHITGNLYISKNCYPQSDYTIGLLCGTGRPEGIDYTIGCAAAEDNTELITVSVSEDGDVTVTFHS